MKRSTKIIQDIEDYFNTTNFKDIVLKNESLINKDVFTIDDIKIKNGFILAPTGQNVLIHYWNKEYYFTLYGSDWDNFKSYTHVKTKNDLKPIFLEALNNGANLSYCDPMKINLYFNK
ncbi:hypothetical protein [uncultured Lutibacter sp.]|uniref:hypothetical protein n=1 Tax=uncultured Lutibacter sp. TaxID=437739 RepID=UPI00260BB5A9|nr:hypothetical protein [uncultured Lutibacter sp.]